MSNKFCPLIALVMVIEKSSGFAGCDTDCAFYDEQNECCSLNAKSQRDVEVKLRT